MAEQNMKKRGISEESDDEELYDKNVRTDKNYKLLSLREKSCHDFNAITLLTEWT